MICLTIFAARGGCVFTTADVETTLAQLIADWDTGRLGFRRALTIRYLIIRNRFKNFDNARKGKLFVLGEGVKTPLPFLFIQGPD